MDITGYNVSNFTQDAKDMGNMMRMKATNRGQLEGHVGAEVKVGSPGEGILGSGASVNTGGRGSAALVREASKNMAYTEFSNIYEKYKDKGIGEVNKQLSGFMGNVEKKAQDHDFVTKTAKALEEGAFKNKEEAIKEAGRLRKDGHTSAADGLENMAKSIKGDEGISFKREKTQGGADISASYKHGTESQHYDLASEREGARLENKDTANMVLDDHTAKLVNDTAKAKGWNTSFEPGDEVTITGAKGAYDWKNLGDVKSFDPAKISSIAGKEGATAERRDLTTQRTGRDEQELDIKQKRAARGAQVEVGNDLMYAVMDNRPEILANGYRSYLSGQGPTTEGRVLVDSMAKTVGGYGSIKQALQDSVTASGGARVSWNGGTLGKIVEDITGVKLNVRGGVETAKTALEKIDADTLRLGFQKHYNEISRNGNEDTKAKELTQLGHDMYKLIESHGEKSTPEQILSKAPNPLKDQKDTSIKPEQTAKSTEGVEGDMLGMPYSEKAEPKNRR